MGMRIVAVGKVKQAWIRAGIEEYLKRLPQLQIREIKDSTPKKEAAKLLASLHPQEKIVLLSEAGTLLTSIELAQFIEQHRSEKLAFIIGGPEGCSDDLRDRAWKILSLSPLTFTHDMARLFLVEQLYRAHTIIHGGSYHK